MLGLSSFLYFCPLAAQEEGGSLLDLLGEEEPVTEYVTAGFKTTRIINGHSFEMNSGGVLDFKISHRFGMLNTGAYEAFGLDNANIRLGLDYGLTDWLNIGIGRSTVQKMIDVFVKWKFLRQSTGARKMPINMLYVADMASNMLRVNDPNKPEYPYTNRLTFTHELIIGSKISESFSWQVMPILVHRNLVKDLSVKNDVFVLGGGFRQKITKRLAITGEYYYVFPDQIGPQFKNSVSVGLDIETGGHVFQLHLTNSTGMTEPHFLTETIGAWDEGGIHFGFNVSRVFTIDRK